MPKNGLRFFFDTPAKTAELHEMTEVGSVAMPFHPSFQINRARLERDLWALNGAAGVALRAGGRGHDLGLGSDGAQQRFAFHGDAAAARAERRWLAAAAARPS